MLVFAVVDENSLSIALHAGIRVDEYASVIFRISVCQSSLPIGL